MLADLNDIQTYIFRHYSFTSFDKFLFEIVHFLSLIF